MMELTAVWKDILTELRQRGDLNIANEKDKNRILRNKESALSKQSALIVQSVGQLRQFLLENRSGYMVGGGGAAGMSELDMDQIDASADQICRKCSELVGTFKTTLNKSQMSGGGTEHFELVGAGLANYLKQVVGIHSEMRAVRVKKQVQLRNLTKLEVNSRESRAHQIPTHSPNTKPSQLDMKEAAMTAAAARTTSSVWDSSDEEEELSPGDAQRFEMENDRLIEQLESLDSQVEQVTSKVVKISELQEIFSEKILQQSADIEHIHTQAVSTTENVKEGNEAVRQAIQNQASYRVIILFVLLVFSFSLLFLDWYNE